MKKFRCYFIAESGKATASLVIEALNADAAATEAMMRLAEHPYVNLEVWDGVECMRKIANPSIPPEVQRRLLSAE